MIPFNNYILACTAALLYPSFTFYLSDGIESSSIVVHACVVI